MKRAFEFHILVQLICILFSLVEPALSPGADFYRWTDSDGVTHVSNQPPDTAAPNKKGVTVLKMHEDTSDKPAGTAVPKAAGSPGIYVVPFIKQQGAMVVDVVLNGRIKAKMLLDTGASMTSINVALLKKLNQSLPAKPMTGKAITAGGTVDVNGIVVDKIDLGGAVREKVWVAYSDQKYDFASCDGLLGMSFLSGFRFTIDYERDTITLQKP